MGAAPMSKRLRDRIARYLHWDHQRCETEYGLVFAAGDSIVISGSYHVLPREHKAHYVTYILKPSFKVDGADC